MQKVLLNDIGEFAQTILGKIETMPREPGKAFVLALRGDLGAGKTTLTQALAKALRIEEAIQSPTYVLMKSYMVPPPPAGGWMEKLIHIDAYRLNSADEFKTLKPEEFLHDPHALIAIEWPERVESALPKPNLTINFSSAGASESERFVEIE